jgi:hypothetical protein
MLERVTDLDAASWIDEALPPLLQWEDPAWRGNFVSHCLPSVFSAYAKIFHPIYADDSVEDRSASWAEADDRPETVGRLVSVGSGPDPFGRRVTWQSLAQELGLTFHAEINDQSLRRRFPDRSFPRYLVGPEEGSLDRPTCQSLVHALTPYTGAEACFFYYVAISTPKIEPLLYRGALTNVFESFDLEGVYGTPTYWWPGSRSWCLCTDWDLTFTLVGGSADLISSLLSTPELEALEVTPSSRVDWQADRVNEERAV